MRPNRRFGISRWRSAPASRPLWRPMCLPGINDGRCRISLSQEGFMRRIQGLLFGLLLASGLRAELPVKQVLTLGVAKKIAAAAEAEALKSRQRQGSDCRHLPETKQGL